MAEAEISLPSHIPWSTSLARFGVIDIDARADHPISVRLGVITDREHRYTLRLGDTFPIRDQTWKLERVEDPQSRKAAVILVKVD